MSKIPEEGSKQTADNTRTSHALPEYSYLVSLCELDKMSAHQAVSTSPGRIVIFGA